MSLRVLNKITTVAILMASLLFTTASANTCGAYCNNDSDCYQGGVVECGKCNLYQGTLGYKTCYNDRPEPPSEPPTPAPTAYNFFPEGGSCKQECITNADCQHGGFNPCGECGQLEGTEMYHVCYQPQQEDEDEGSLRKLGACGSSCESNHDCGFEAGSAACRRCNLDLGTNGYKTCMDYEPEADSPTSSLTHEGSRHLDSCGASCDSDSDCHQGGFITCGKCNLYQGTLGYKTCYNDEPEPPTSAPTTSHNFFPIGGSCRNSCKSNADCQHGGFNPCGKCGQVPGTEMYHVCYQPDNEGRRRLRGSM
jgi:hypothetical protein